MRPESRTYIELLKTNPNLDDVVIIIDETAFCVDQIRVATWELLIVKLLPCVTLTIESG